jgi:hypothetical protein
MAKRKRRDAAGGTSKPGKGELRRRVRAFIEDGSLARLGSEGRLVAHYVFERADWSTGEIRFSMRHVARVMQVSPTAIRRGVEQMIRQEILAISVKGEGSGRSKYTVVGRTHSVSTPDTLRAQARAHSVSGVDTPRVRSAHTVCPERAHSVSGARTPCDPYSVLFSGIPVNTTGVTNAADASERAGTSEAQPQPEFSRDSAAAAAAAVASPATLTDEVQQ